MFNHTPAQKHIGYWVSHNVLKIRYHIWKCYNRNFTIYKNIACIIIIIAITIIIIIIFV